MQICFSASLWPSHLEEFLIFRPAASRVVRRSEDLDYFSGSIKSSLAIVGLMLNIREVYEI